MWLFSSDTPDALSAEALMLWLITAMVGLFVLVVVFLLELMPRRLMRQEPSKKMRKTCPCSQLTCPMTSQKQSSNGFSQQE
jgi:hypothetical protein